MSTLRFSYELVGYGSATAIIGTERSSVQILTSYVGDALASLLRAVAAAGDSTQTRHSAIFAGEPDIYMWDFWPISRDWLITSIVHYPMRGEEQLPSRGEAGTLLFEMETNWRHVASTIAKTVQIVQRQYGPEYERQWGHPFPTDDLNRLTDKLSDSSREGDG